MATEPRNTGGPAFPRASATVSRWENNHEVHETHVGQDGMPLRDWFAGLALPAMTSDDVTDAAARAYQLADAMLRERSKA